jgi:hypothetical protein
MRPPVAISAAVAAVVTLAAVVVPAPPSWYLRRHRNRATR